MPLPTRPNNKQGYPLSIEVLRVLGDVHSKIGGVGVILITMITLVLVYTDHAKKMEIIDTWVLFKAHNCNSYFYWAIFGILLLALIQTHFATKTIKHYKKELDRCSTEKSELHNKILGIPLSTSKRSK